MTQTTFSPELAHIIVAIIGAVLGYFAKHWGIIGGPAPSAAAVQAPASAPPTPASSAGPSAPSPLANDIAARIDTHLEVQRQKAIDQVVAGILAAPKS